MSPSTDASTFIEELGIKLDELIQWSIENSPVQEKSLSRQDFSKIRASFISTASETNQQEQEPEDGGAQYINDNPAPWP